MIRLLLDTNVLIDVISKQPTEGFSEPDLFDEAVGQNPFLVSVLSIWEIEIKSRIKRLHLNIATVEIGHLVRSLGGVVVDVTEEHILATLDVEPDTRDPFDRLLLTTAVAEGAFLLTRDHILLSHPQVWRPFPQ
jgi:PIN domain nuclease of toxin-antitoxin system